MGAPDPPPPPPPRGPRSRSASVDWATRRPWSRITTLSTVWATSARMWLETRNGLPFGGEATQQQAEPVDALGIAAVRRLVQDQDLRVARAARRPGSAAGACPSENLPTRRRRRAVRSTRSRTSSTRDLGAAPPAMACTRR